MQIMLLIDAKADSFAHCEQIMEEEIDYVDRGRRIVEQFKNTGNELAASNADKVLST